MYGIDIKTPWPVSGVPARTAGQWDVEFVQGDPDTLAAAAAHVPASQAQSWAQHAALPDGSTYRRWTDLFEFLVSADARHIQARTLKDGCEEVLVGYLLVDALSFSMVRLGWEPLHATAVLTKHGVVAFIAESGGGKSTMGALLVQGGCRLVTDDMLALTATHDRFVAEPGPPRIKLYRDIAMRIFGSARDGVKMNPVTEKLIIRLGADEVVREAHPLAAIYLIGEPQRAADPDGPSIHRLSPASALPRILAATAAHYPSEPARLERQFKFVTALVSHVPVKSLSYHRNKDEMSRVREAVLADLGPIRGAGAVSRHARFGDALAFRRRTVMTAVPAAARLDAVLRGEIVTWSSLETTPSELLRLCAALEISGLVHQRLARLRVTDRLARRGPPGARDRGAPGDCNRARPREGNRRRPRCACGQRHPAGALEGTTARSRPLRCPGTEATRRCGPAGQAGSGGAVKRVMTALGYVEPALSDGELLFCQFQMTREDHLGVGHVFDVHWKISTQTVFADVLTYDELAASAAPVPALGPHARTTGGVHALLLACIHPVMHHQNADRLIWLYDIHLLVDRLSEVELERFASLARQKRVAAICLHQLLLTRARFRTEALEWVDCCFVCTGCRRTLRNVSAGRTSMAPRARFERPRSHTAGATGSASSAR